MNCFKGDEVKLKSGESGIVIDTWGVARDWLKLKTSDGDLIYTTVNHVESIINSFAEKRRKRR